VEPVVCDDFCVNVDVDEVLRMMGIPKRGRPRSENAPGQALELYPGVLDEALRMVRPKAIYTVCPISDLRYHTAFRRASHVGFGVCTIGPAVEEESADCARRGESLRALLLDAIGSEAVESVVDQSAERIRAAAADMGLEAGKRFSPGYGRWPLEEQRSLFGIVDGGAIGVTLNEACIMIPRKSVSFAIRIGRKPDAL
jgi:cobalamin-dependent methionine synthase I